MSEGARNAANSAGAGAAAPAQGDAPKRRFAPEEGSVSFAVARGLLPTTPLRLTATIFLGLAAAAVMIAGDYYQSQAPGSWRAVLDLDASTSLARWAVSTMLLATGALCLVVFGLRGSRTDDVKGLYRWWFTSGVALFFASVVFTTQAHTVVSSQLSAATGVSALNGQLWWFAPAALALIVLALRPLGDLCESTLSFGFTLLAAGALLASAAATVGLLPAAWLGYASAISLGGLLIALVCVGSAQLLYARRVLLETDGVIAAPTTRQRAAKPTKKPGSVHPAEAARQPEKTPENKPEPKPAPQPARAQQAATPSAGQPTIWTDGSDGSDSDYGDDAPRRKLTKAERKRLRKQKAGRYAA